MHYLLGIDGGATKTQSKLVTETGKHITGTVTAELNYSNLSPFQLEKNFGLALDAIQAASGQEFLSIKKAVVGISGADNQKELKDCEKIFTKAIKSRNKITILKLKVVNDAEIALKSGSSKSNTLIIIAGTGSNCFGQNSTNKTAKAGGMDYLLSDQGSSYAVGLKMLKSAIKSYDGRIPKSLLEDKIREFYKIRSIADLKDQVYHPPLTKAQVAQLAVWCKEALLAGDSEAKSIFDSEIKEILLMVATVLKKLGLQTKSTDLVLAGGLLIKNQYVQDEFVREIHNRYPKINIIIPNSPPVDGAIKMALAK